ncbi:MAG: type IA DNA topoisomerase [Lachnospiraceae bacterium]|nr:type IA DNA topoisomerase [Candidatus Equihabitans merdae]
MGKWLFIAEKPSVAQEFARVMGVSGPRRDGYMESEDKVVTWCVGHLVTMSYPEKYDASLKKWKIESLPFLPSEFKYEVISDVEKQFNIVRSLLERPDVERIYVCTDSGREGEYIYRLVEQMSDPSVARKDRRRVWIDSQTEEEIKRGIAEAKDLSEYDNLSASAYLRAKEDYLIGINFSRILTLKYGQGITNFLGGKWSAVSAGRVMTCVLGMVVRREREIRDFVKTSFYRVLGQFDMNGTVLEGEWKSSPGSQYENSPLLYKENGFKKREDAEKLISSLKNVIPQEGLIEELTRKKEKKAAPLLYNLAELQNDCSRLFKLSPDQTLSVAQELYEKKMTTYPRTDARVLSTAVAKEIYKNIKGLTGYEPMAAYATEILDKKAYASIAKSRYTNDKAITDHYAIIPTGAGLQNLRSLSSTSAAVYKEIVRRFLAIFYPAAEYDKTAVTLKVEKERFYVNFRYLSKEGYLVTADKSRKSDKDDDKVVDTSSLKKGQTLTVLGYNIKEGETSPPKRYTSGSMILAMENAGQLIEDESLREQIKGSGIGTSATRAEILKRLVKIRYLSLNKKTQVITPELQGEMVYDAVEVSIRSLLNPELTASWEKGLTYVAEGKITPDEYMQKLEKYISQHVNAMKDIHNETQIRRLYQRDAAFYKTKPKTRSTSRKKEESKA